MGQSVLDQKSGNAVYYPDGVSSDEIEKSMSDFNNGTITDGKPTWWDNVKDTIQRTTGNFNFDPVMTAKSAVGGAVEALSPIVPHIGQFNPLTGITPEGPSPQEKEAFKDVSPGANFIGNAIGQVGSFMGLEALTGGMGGILSKIPAVAKFIQGASVATKAAQEAGTISAEGVKVSQGAASFGATTAEYGALSSAEQQKEQYGNVQLSDVAQEAIKQGIVGLATGGILHGVTRPLADLGADQSITAELSKRMIASGTVMGATTAAQGGSPRDILMATTVGALFPALHFHGEIQEVRQAAINSAIQAKQANIVDQTGADSSTALQIAHEHTLNQAEEVINEAHAAIMDNKPLPEEQRQGASKVFSDPYDPKLFDHLSQFFSPDILVKMDGEERVWLGNQSLKDLNGWAESHKELDWEKAIQEDYLKKSDSEIIEDDARRARGIPVDKNALDEVSSSKELTTNLIAKTANELTGGGKGENTPVSEPKGGKNAEKGREQVTQGSGEKGIVGEGKTGVHLGDDAEKGITETKEVENSENKGVEGIQEPKVAKAASDVNAEFVKQGFKGLSDEEQARFNPIKIKEQEEKISSLISDRQKTNDILDGKESLPSDVHPQVFFNAVKARAIEEGDYETGKKLADSSIGKQLSLSAQTMRASQTFENGGSTIDPVKEIQEIDKVKAEKTPKEIAKKISKDIQTGIEKVKKDTVIKQSEFDKFIAKLRC
jgi:hypothetical protein